MGQITSKLMKCSTPVSSAFAVSVHWRLRRVSYYFKTYPRVLMYSQGLCTHLHSKHHVMLRVKPGHEVPACHRGDYSPEDRHPYTMQQCLKTVNFCNDARLFERLRSKLGQKICQASFCDVLGFSRNNDPERPVLKSSHQDLLLLRKSLDVKVLVLRFKGKERAETPPAPIDAR